MIEKIELIDAELDAVCGGSGSVVNLGNIIVAPEINTQTAIAVGGFSLFGNVGGANASNSASQLAFSAFA
jgi:hypothetical protein